MIHLLRVLYAITLNLMTHGPAPGHCDNFHIHSYVYINHDLPGQNQNKGKYF